MITENIGSVKLRLSYWVGIKRRFWFGYKMYHVFNHFYETHLEVKQNGKMVYVPINPRMVLEDIKGRFIVISNIWARDWLIKDFRNGNENKPVLPERRAEETPPPATTEKTV
jgi:hypothetical protein